MIEVTDTGPGLPAGAGGSVFERFGRGGGTGPGFGVGLALARWVVEAHGGSLSAGSPADGGLLLTVRLPLAATETP